jgi:hypothetical protein
MLNGSYPTLSDAREMLPGAVFLSIDPATKSPIHGKKWQQITLEQSLKEGHQRLLEAAESIGVLLGPPSGDIVEIDCDSMPLFNLMPVLNPFLANTLSTRGRRGGGYWIRMIGEYPARIYVLAVESDNPLGTGLEPDPKSGLIHIGEFRGGRAQSIICGRHQSGCYYTWPNRSALVPVRFGDFTWPPISLPWISKVKNTKNSEVRLAGPGAAGADAQTTPSSNPDNDLLQRAKAILTIPVLWKHFRLPPITGNPVLSPFRHEENPSFSIYDDGNRCKDHGGDGREGDSYDFYQWMTGKNAKTAFKEFVILAGLGAELRGHKVSSTANQKEMLILPSDFTPYIESASDAFSKLAPDHEYFVRGRAIVEIAFHKILKDGQSHDVFQLLDPDSFRSRIEHKFKCYAWREHGPKRILKETRCPHDSAVVLLKSIEAIQLLPHIATLAAAPVITGEAGNLKLLGKGYHDINNGIFVVRGNTVPILPLQESIEIILDVLSDYEFVTDPDKSRAVASIISPALHFGRLIDGDFPLDIAEADASQSGKTYRQKLVCAIYGETPYVITKREGGVGSLDESVSSAFIAGSPFILFDNIRGRFESQITESALRGAGHVNARVPHRGEIQVPAKHINWQLSINGLESTRDLCYRSIITRICKHKAGFEFRRYTEGDLLRHIKVNQLKFLGAVFAIVIEWDRQGRKHSDDYRHDFVEWAQTLDWIVQNIFDLPALLEGHVEEILRISDPALSWLRAIAIAVERDNRLNEALSASEIGDVCQLHGIDFPGCRYLPSLDQVPLVTGKLLNRVFREICNVAIDRYEIRRETKKEYHFSSQRVIDKHYHWFSKRTSNQTENTPF